MSLQRRVFCLTRAVCAAAVCVMLLSAAQADIVRTFGSGGNVFSMDFVHVGDTGNAADSTNYGAVGYAYDIGMHHVTNAQYTAFLNAVAATDTYGLYNANMGSNASSGISRSGDSGSYTYAVRTDTHNRGLWPVNFVSWNTAARFTNWLTTGNTESGVYNTTDWSINRDYRNAGVAYFLPTEDEWYKAAYYKGGGTDAGYWLYPTMSDSVPAVIYPDSYTGGDKTMPDDGVGAVYRRNRNQWPGGSDEFDVLFSAGSHPEAVTRAGGPSAYDTMGQGGNMWEWNEALINSNRGIRGGAFNSNTTFMPASYRHAGLDPTYEDATRGFRVASIPEPGSATTMLLMGVVGLLFWRRRRNA